MIPPRFEYYTRTFRSEESLANVALQWRKAGGIYNSGYFDIVTFFEDVLHKKEFAGKGILSLEFLDEASGYYPAYVSYNPLTLHIDPEVWQLAKQGDPISRHIIAHEIGHVILHDHHAKAFSNDHSQNAKFAQNEYRVEWQADRFADHLLAPDHIVRAFNDHKTLAAHCFVPAKLAQERFDRVSQTNRKLPRYSGEACPKCNNFTLARTGLRQKCETCGKIVSEF